MRIKPGKFACNLMVSLTLAGCSHLPTSGPAHRSIERWAAGSLRTQPGSVIFPYALVDLNRSTLPFVYDPGPGSFFQTFGTGRGPAPEILVGIGDQIQVTIFEESVGGLFIPTDAGARPGNFVTLPTQTVDAKGNISIPYGGQIRALGRSAPSIQQDIVKQLKSRAIEPQAIVSILGQTSTEVTVIGDVGAPNKIAINAAGDTVLDVISRVGGIKYPGYETFVTLQRHGLKGTVYFLNLIKNPKENIFIKPGDALYVYQYQRSFMAFGATGQSGQFKFLQENVNLSDAVGKVGGLLDSRSDPGQVFVYRLEDRSALQQMGINVSRFPDRESKIPTIYRVNFRDPTGFFAARRFPMQDADVIYVDNADQVEITKFLTLITTITGSAATVAGDIKTVRSPVPLN